MARIIKGKTENNAAAECRCGRRRGGIGLALILLALAAGAAVYFYPVRTISVSGVCNAKIARDKFSIVLDITALDARAAASISRAQLAADEIARRVRATGDNTLEVQTTRINSNEKTRWEKDTQIILGIETEISLKITTSRRESLNAVLNGVDVPGANVMPRGMNNFSSNELIQEETEKCLQVAVANARDKAEAIAKASGNKLGRLIAAQVGGTSSGDDYAPTPRRAKLMMFAAESSSGDYIQSSDGELSLTIGAVFGIR